MLLLALGLSLILLGAGLVAIWRGGWWIAFFVACGLILIFCPPHGGSPFGYTVVGLQFLGLLVAVPVMRFLPRYRKRLGIGLPIAVTIGACGFCCWIPIREFQEFERLRELYTFESMEEWVPAPNPSLRAASLSPVASAELKDLEDLTDSASTHGSNRSRRLSMLHEIHAMTVEAFVNSPGFGVGRRITPSEETMVRGLRDERPVPQPNPRAAPAESIDPVVPTLSTAIPVGLLGMHRRGALDFAYPSGTGYVMDRQHVAGFRPHGFSKVPESKESWALETVDLVSLLCHSEPVAYLSANLPKMDELRGAETRPLDGFEAAGLEQLRAGEYLVSAESGPRLRLLGSIRAGKQCVKCHGAERGDLLGAFSYTLRRAMP